MCIFQYHFTVASWCNTINKLTNQRAISWSNMKITLFNANLLESNFMFSFLEKLDQKRKTMFLLGDLSLPLDSNTTIIVKRSVYVPAQLDLLARFDPRQIGPGMI